MCVVRLYTQHIIPAEICLLQQVHPVDRNVLLTRGQKEAQRVAQRIDQGMDLGV